MNVDLPPLIRNAFEGQILEKYMLSALTEAATEVSIRYRREGAGQKFQIISDIEAMSYVAARMPATYAANVMAMAKLSRGLPDFDPQSCLDIGAGPGTSTVAARQMFENLETIDLVEPNKFLRKIGQELLNEPLAGAAWHGENIESYQPSQNYDLVIASYVFNEIDQKKLGILIDKLWSSCSGAMVILEPGTPQGFGIILAIRRWAISRGINIAAPCPHMNECPLADAEDRWCHFSVRTSRSKLHKALKGGEAGFEDEKFSYIVLSRAESPRPTHRIIGHPSGTKLRELQVCGPRGAETIQVSKSHPLHKLSKKLEWGDGFDI